MTWRRETVKARFLRKINRALGRCAHCTRLCRPHPALHPPIRGAMTVDIKIIKEES